MLHRLRSVLVRPGRDRLSGTVEVDETYFGGEEPGLRGGRQKGKKVLVELREPRGFGRCRMAVLADASAASLEGFVTENVEEGSTPGPTIRQPSETATSTSRSTSSAVGSPLTSCPRAPSLAKRWLRVALTKLISRITSTSGSSASIADARRAEGYFSTDCSRSLSTTTQCATGSSPPTPSRRRCHPCRRGDGGIPRASTGLKQNAPGDRPPDQEESAQMDIPFILLRVRRYSRVHRSHW